MSEPTDNPGLYIPDTVNAEQLKAAVDTQLAAYAEVSQAIHADLNAIIDGCVSLAKDDLNGVHSCILSHLVGQSSGMNGQLAQMQSAISAAIQSLSGSLMDLGMSLNPDQMNPSIFIPPTTLDDMSSPVSTRTLTAPEPTDSPASDSQPPVSSPASDEPGAVQKAGGGYDVYFNYDTCVCKQLPTGTPFADDGFASIATDVSLDAVTVFCAQLVTDCILQRQSGSGSNGGIQPTLPGGNGDGDPVLRRKSPVGGTWGDGGWYVMCPAGQDWVNKGGLRYGPSYFDKDTVPLPQDPSSVVSRWFGPFPTEKSAADWATSMACVAPDGTGTAMPTPTPTQSPAACCYSQPDWDTWLGANEDKDGVSRYLKWAGAAGKIMIDNPDIDSLNAAVGQAVEDSFNSGTGYTVQ